MVRRHAVALRRLVLVAPLALLAGCSQEPEIVSDPSDLDAAVAVWSDPWVVPTSATVAGPALGSDGWVDRTVARRQTSYDASAEQVAKAELAVARAAGWVPTSSTCDDTVQVALAGPGEALAQLVVAEDGTAEVEVAARHHLDSAWEVPAATEDGTTCLTGETPPFEAPPLRSAPFGDEDASDDATAEWSDSEADSDLLADVNADLERVGLRVVAPTSASGVNRRQAPAAETYFEGDTLAAVLNQLPGWRPTYASCGAQGPAKATFVRDFDGVPAVLAAEVGPDGMTLRVTLPVVEGPEPTWLDDLAVPSDMRCLRRTPSRRIVAGTPAVLPSVLDPDR